MNGQARSRRVEDSRRDMVAHIARHVRDQRVLIAMAAVPREPFVPEPIRATAYADHPLPIGKGQTISQPLMVAIMLEALELRGPERVLEVGTGSGYQAALLSHLAGEVWSVEIVPELAERARLALAQLEAENLHVVVGDGGLGWPAAGPFDAIVVAASSPHVPAALLQQLADGGRLVMPIGDDRGQELIRIRRRGGDLVRQRLGACRFVPLVGEHGVDRPHWEAAQLGAAMSVCRRAEQLASVLSRELAIEELTRIAAAIKQTRAAVFARDAELARSRAAALSSWVDATLAGRP